MKETTVHLSEEEYLWVKSKGNNYLRHLVQLTMKLEVFFTPTVTIESPIDEKGAGQ